MQKLMKGCNCVGVNKTKSDVLIQENIHQSQTTNTNTNIEVPSFPFRSKLRIICLICMWFLQINLSPCNVTNAHSWWHSQLKSNIGL
jgi:hypothetical protein